MIINSMIVMLLSLVLLRTWRHLDLQRTRWLILGGIASAPLGVFVLNIAEPGLLRIIIGVVIVILGLLNLRESQLSIATFPGSGTCYGFITCLAVTAISIGGPPRRGLCHRTAVAHPNSAGCPGGDVCRFERNGRNPLCRYRPLRSGIPWQTWAF